MKGKQDGSGLISGVQVRAALETAVAKLNQARVLKPFYSTFSSWEQKRTAREGVKLKEQLQSNSSSESEQLRGNSNITPM